MIDAILIAEPEPDLLTPSNLHPIWNEQYVAVLLPHSDLDDLDLLQNRRFRKHDPWSSTTGEESPESENRRGLEPVMCARKNRRWGPKLRNLPKWQRPRRHFQQKARHKAGWARMSLRRGVLYGLQQAGALRLPRFGPLMPTIL